MNIEFDIKNPKTCKKTIIQFIKFGLVGISNTAISLGIYYLWLFISEKCFFSIISSVFIKDHLYLIGNVLGFIISVLNSYYWNNKYVFKKGNKGHLKRILKTFVAYGTTSFILSTGILWLAVDIIGISNRIAPLISLIITIPVNFIINKFWAFKK